MSQGFGREIPSPHVQPQHRAIARYLIVVHSADGPLAYLFAADRQPLVELDANTEDVTTMLAGLTPTRGAAGSEWDATLSGHGAEERARAAVYTLPV